MMRSLVLATIALVGCFSTVNSLQASAGGRSRRAFLSQSVSTTAAILASSAFAVQNAQATPEILSTPRGVKYAVLKASKDKSARPQKGDIVAIEYTGRCIIALGWYLSSCLSMHNEYSRLSLVHLRF
jgi:hypothetical protein